MAKHGGSYHRQYSARCLQARLLGRGKAPSEHLPQASRTMAHPIVRYATTIAPLLLFLGCAPQEDAHGPLVIDTMASPAGPGSGEPNLASAPDGRIYLSWLEPVDDSTHALRFSTLVGSRWSPPRTI